MKKVLLTAMMIATVATGAMANGGGNDETSLYATYHGDFGACVNDKGFFLCVGDWINGS